MSENRGVCHASLGICTGEVAMTLALHEKKRRVLVHSCPLNAEDKERGQICAGSELLTDISHRLRETQLAAHGTNDKLLVYFIERALFHSEALAVVGR